MGTIKCYDIIADGINGMSERFRSHWKLNDQKLNEFRGYCAMIDRLAEEADGQYYDAEIYENTARICIILDCVDLSIRDKDHPYFDLINHADLFSYSVSDEGYLRVKFFFPGVWDKIEVESEDEQNKKRET